MNGPGEIDQAAEEQDQHDRRERELDQGLAELPASRDGVLH